MTGTTAADTDWSVAIIEVAKLRKSAHYSAVKHAILLAALLALPGCFDLVGPISREEVAWANAPDGLTHAILLQTNGGATTS